MMTKRNGLLFVAKAVAVLVATALILPGVGFAQSDESARVKIQGDPDNLGDVLLVKDGDDIVLYGLAGAVPPLSRVTITAGDQTFERNASFIGKFPLLADVPVRITGGTSIDSATVTAVNTEGTYTGTVNLDVASNAVFQQLINYQTVARTGDTVLADSLGTPPNILLDVVAESATDRPFVGKVLLTQRLIGSGADAILVDQFEGISGGGFDANNRIRSVTPFSVIDVYSTAEAADLVNPDRTQRIETLQTEVFYQGDFRSNGSFAPFSIADANSTGQEGSLPTLFLRITARKDAGADGEPPKVYLARINNKVSTEIASTAVTNNNTQGAGINGIATIAGTADSYALITAYAENSTSSDVIAQATADASGNFTMLVPSNFNADGVYQPQTQVFLNALDIFANESALAAVELDTESMIFEQPVATDQGDGTFLVSGVAEPNSIILVTGNNRAGDVVFHAGQMIADSDGSFSVTAQAAYEFTVTAIDQAGNSVTSTAVPATQNTSDPSNLTTEVVFPNIRLSGTVASNLTGDDTLNSSVRIFAFPLNDVPAAQANTDTLPSNAFYVTQTNADATGNFTVLIPGGISRYILVQSIDNLGNESQYIAVELVDTNGNPITRALVTFDSLSVTNNAPGIDDVLSGRVVDINSGAPVTDVYVNAFLTTSTDPNADFPFLESLFDTGFDVAVDANGQFQIGIPDVSPISETRVESFYLVALEQREDFTNVDIGFMLVDANSDLNGDGTADFDRVGPRITFSPTIDDVQLIQSGAGADDYLNIANILPSSLGAGPTVLPNDALPIITVLTDGNSDSVIDVNDPSIVVLDRKPLDAMMGVPIGLGVLPIPGVSGLRLGQNYWDASTGTSVGNSVVFVALMDQFGNLSPNPLRVALDVTVDDPDTSLITGSGSTVFGSQESVESNALVTVYSNADKSGVLGSTTSTIAGAFAVPNLTISQTTVYVAVRDSAGNESNAVPVRVYDPVESTQYLILDQLGLIHTSGTSLSTGLTAQDDARALAAVPGNNSLFYVLLADGSIRKVGESGQSPLVDDLVILEKDKIARDLEVISADPVFSGYVLLGNGVVVPYGNAPFFGDIASLQLGLPDGPRLPLPNSELIFVDVNGDGVYNTEDANGNGALDVVVDFGGVVTVNEDTNGNGELDAEPLIDPNQSVQGFGIDIARDLELVTDSNGNVKGYVIMDGFGVMWAFGTDIGAENVVPLTTNGYSETDLFRSFKLILNDDGSIRDFISLNGNGDIFGFPGGLLGAGPATDTDNAGNLTGVMGATNFGFDIARDIVMSPVDSNGDGTLDYQDGFYILDGFGGIHAIGGAPEINDAPFLGFDVARELEFGASILR